MKRDPDYSVTLDHMRRTLDNFTDEIKNGGMDRDSDEIVEAFKKLIRIFEQNKMMPETIDLVKKIHARGLITFGFLLEEYLSDLEKKAAVEN